MVMGCLAFLVVALTIVPAQGAKPLGVGLLTVLVLSWTVGVIPLRFLVVRLFAAKARARILRGRSDTASPTPHSPERTPRSWRESGMPAIDAKAFLPVCQAQTLIGAALMEGGAMLAVAVYLAEGDLLNIACALLLMAAVALHLPTRWRVIGCVERQLDLIRPERQTAG